MHEAATSTASRPPRRWPWLAAAALVAVLLGAMLVQRIRGPLVPAVVVRRAPLTQRVVVSGRVTAPAQIQIAPNVAGTVAAVRVEEGDVVEPGATLVELVASELDASVAQARAAVQLARARQSALRRVTRTAQEEAVRQALVSHGQAERRLARLRTLAQAGSATQQDVDDAEGALQLAASRLSSARAQAESSSGDGADVQAAQAGVAEAEAHLAAARARRGHATLTTPVKAQVLRRLVEPGDAVSPGRIVLVLARAGATRLSVEPDEKSLAFVKPGQPALASADAFRELRFDAVVESVAPAVNPDRGTIEVKLRVPAPPDYLRPDMTVSVDIEVAAKDAALVVPAEAVRDPHGPKPWVLKARDGRAVREDVRLGLSGEGRVELVRGVGEGEVLLVAPALEPGSRVRAVPREG